MANAKSPDMQSLTFACPNLIAVRIYPTWPAMFTFFIHT